MGKKLERLNKYDHGTRSAILKLIQEGYVEYEICDLMGISRNTLHRWKQRDPMLVKGMEQYRHEYLKSQIDKAMLAKAVGHTIDEIKEEFIETRTRRDGSEYIVKVTKTRKQLPPDMKALERYIKKYAPELDMIEKKSESQITVNIGGMSYRELLDYNASNNVIDCNDYKDLEEVGTPLAVDSSSDVGV